MRNETEENVKKRIKKPKGELKEQKEEKGSERRGRSERHREWMETRRRMEPKRTVCPGYRTRDCVGVGSRPKDRVSGLGVMDL